MHAQWGSSTSAQVNNNATDENDSSVIQPHSFDDLIANYNGYITNYMNVLDAYEGNLIVRVLQSGKRVKWLIEDFSYSSAVILNAIVQGELADEDFIADYLDYVKMPFLKELNQVLDSGERARLEFISKGNKSLYSDICMLHQFAPETVLPEDQIFFDAITSAYTQIIARDFNYSNNEGSYKGYRKYNALTYPEVQPIFTYFDSTRDRVLRQYGIYSKEAKGALENLKKEDHSSEKIANIYFQTSNQKAALLNIWQKDSQAFIILEAFDGNSRKRGLDDVSIYQSPTLIQSILADNRFTQRLAAVGQFSLLKRNKSKMQASGVRLGEIEKAMDAVLDEQYYGNDSFIYSYFDFLDEEELNSAHYILNTTNVWYPSYSKEVDANEDLKSDIGQGLFVSAGYITNAISTKNVQGFSQIKVPSQYSGYHFTVGYIKQNSGAYLSFYNAGNLEDFYFRHVEYGGVGMIPLSKNGRSYISLSVPLRYSRATLVNPFDLNYFSSAPISADAVEVAKTNGLSLGLGIQYMVYPLRFWSISAEAKYFSNSIYRPQWKVKSNHNSNLNSFNFRGFQLGVSSSIYFSTL